MFEIRQFPFVLQVAYRSLSRIFFQKGISEDQEFLFRKKRIFDIYNFCSQNFCSMSPKQFENVVEMFDLNVTPDVYSTSLFAIRIYHIARFNPSLLKYQYSDAFYRKLLSIFYYIVRRPEINRNYFGFNNHLLCNMTGLCSVLWILKASSTYCDSTSLTYAELRFKKCFAKYQGNLNQLFFPHSLVLNEGSADYEIDAFFLLLDLNELLLVIEPLLSPNELKSLLIENSLVFWLRLFHDQVLYLPPIGDICPNWNNTIRLSVIKGFFQALNHEPLTTFHATLYSNYKILNMLPKICPPTQIVLFDKIILY